MILCELNEQDVPLVCSYEDEIFMKRIQKLQLSRIWARHEFDLTEAKRSESLAQEFLEKVNGR